MLGLLALVLLLAYGTLSIAGGRLGVVDVKATQVAIRVDYLTGTTSVIQEPGYQLFVPYFQDVALLDKSPVEFQMQGDVRRGANEVPFLLVRSKDGSNFWFESLEIQYRLIPNAADHVLTECGPADAFKNQWMRAFARPVLRDEFGRYAAEEIANPTLYETAKQRSKQRLNTLLGPHGVAVIEITTPKPRFEVEYETAIEARKVAGQEVQRLRGEMDQLEQERETRLATVEKEVGIDRERLLGKMRADELAAATEETEVRARAELYARTQRADGNARRGELLAQATSLETAARHENDALRRRVEALASGGDIAVREALFTNLAKTRIRVVSRDRGEDDRGETQ